jgi:hypothetical protein
MMDKPSFTQRILLNSGIDTPTEICSCATASEPKAKQIAASENFTF